VASIFSRENLLRSLLALACFAAVIFFFSPSWAAFSLWARVPELGGMLEVRRGVNVLQQVAHPGSVLTDPLHQAIQWRLLFPVIAHVLHLPPFAVFGLAYVGCVAALGYLVALLRRHGGHWIEATLGAIAIGAASWLFVSTGWLGYYDSWLALGLLIVTFGRPFPLWAACVWAPWVDERFVMAVPIALLCRWLYAATRSDAPRYDWRTELGVPAAIVAVYLLVRLGLLSGQSAANATVGGYFGKDYLNAPPGRIALGVWDGLRGAWILVIAAILALRTTPGRAALLGVAVVVTVAAGLATAQDYSRSMTMLLPVAVLGLVLVVQTRPRSERWLLGSATGLALLLPAHHVMNDAVNPIYYLYHELAAYDSPPPAAMPELREFRAINEMEQGDFAGAERDLTIAIKLSPNPASPARRRGMLYASAKRWEQAKADLTTVVENEPADPEGWFLRAEIELAMRDIDAARADLDHARSVAPAGWANRPDVSRFAAMLNSQSGQR
jgi:hypothetical protein